VNQLQYLSRKYAITHESLPARRSIPLDGSNVQEKRQQLLNYFVSTWEQYESLFFPIKDEAFYVRAESLRHPLIFYFGHTATFYINKMILAQFTDARIDHELEAIFAVGVDEMSWDDLDASHYDWPTVEVVKCYRDKVKARICAFIQSMQISLPITQQSPAWLVLMGIEHERIHLETSSVIMRMLPLGLIDSVKASLWPVCMETGPAPSVEWLPVCATTVKLGKGAGDCSYGWDNEYGCEEQQVEQFKIATTLVSNQDFLEFIRARGYKEARYWTEEGRLWLDYTQASHPRFWRPTLDGKYLQRNLFSEMPLPMNWPVEVNYLEAKAYCNWMQEVSGEPVRLPMEAEWSALRKSELGSGPGEGNINLEQYASSCPVSTNRQGRLYDITGNVWQWTETPIDGFPGFEVHPWYDDFSTPTFDGKHNLIKGGSWISTGNETLASSRYAFRRHFFQHAGFRMVISEQQPQEQLQDNVYETDELIAQYCEFHYGREYFSVKNFPVACVEVIMSHVQGNNVATERALDLGCAVGRSSFELAKYFQHVDAIDFSARFVQQGAKLQAQNRLRYTVPVEGDIVEYREVLLDELGYDETKGRIDFLQGDACNLKPHFADYNLIFAGNLIDRLYDPAMFLKDIQERILSGGLLVLTSPYTWLEEYTEKSNWLGGKKVNGENFSTLDALKQHLADSFDFEEAVDVPFVIRETARKHQHTVAQMTVWRKR
tara:strand:- start:1572 stop:3722 length:2151 start_codon:yes stop_codon:yes gene_type:complete